MIPLAEGDMNQPVERRLAAILAADVAGYLRLMGADEEGTHGRLTAHIWELVEFPSIVDAVTARPRSPHRSRMVRDNVRDTGQKHRPAGARICASRRRPASTRSASAPKYFQGPAAALRQSCDRVPEHGSRLNPPR